MPETTEILPPRYRGAKQVGKGGMGEIYRATDSTLGRAVAVKMLAARFADDEAVRERFTREALSAARLSGDPSIVTIYDVGEWDERPYIVMEYMGGGSLEQKLRAEGAQPPAQVVQWLEQAARALDHAQAEGVVHRDVKPGNLLLDREGNVHVADFGIASAAGMDSMTMTGTVMGTAGYLAPEQAQGERAGPASDRYALGVVAFELLTGTRPFESDSPTAEAAAHVHADVPPFPSVRICRRSSTTCFAARSRSVPRTGTPRPPSSSARCAVHSTRRRGRHACSVLSRHRPRRVRPRSGRCSSVGSRSRRSPASSLRRRCPAGRRP